VPHYSPDVAVFDEGLESRRSKRTNYYSEAYEKGINTFGY